MPREVKAFLCVFKCGRHSTLKRKTIDEHETKCARNPARKSCKTCVHDRAEDGYDGGGFYCEIEKKPDFVSEIPGDILSAKKAVVLMYDCPYWESKVAPSHPGEMK